LGTLAQQQNLEMQDLEKMHVLTSRQNGDYDENKRARNELQRVCAVVEG